MGVRKTESRLPSGYQSTDLGESVQSPDGKISLISFFTSPLSPGLQNTYVIIISDASLAGNTKSFEWHIVEDGTSPRTHTTTFGEIDHMTENFGNLTISVKLLDGSGAKISSLVMVQRIEQLNPTTEEEIKVATEKEGAGAANPAIVRELINGFQRYYKNLQPQVAESGDAFQRFVAGLVFRGSLKNTPEKRKENFSRLADTIDQNPDAFAVEAGNGIGACDMRVALLAMVYPSGSPLFPWTELPEPGDQNTWADDQLREKFSTVSESDKIDLLNLARFPKTNIALCAKIIEALRNKYFAGANFNDVMTGMNGTRGHWILKHYLKGPLKT